VFRDRIKDVVRLRESPHRIALAFSTGVFVGMSPLLGLHTLLGVSAAWLFRLNTFAIIAGVHILNLWTIVPLYSFSIWVGAKCLGIKQIIPKIDWSNNTFNSLLNSFEHLIIPFIFGTFLVSLVSAVISYIVIYRAAKRRNVFNK
jgi:uncharacterized protein (DUF2062 family)